MLIRFALTLLGLSSLLSCGYAFVGMGSSLPKQIKSINIPIFLNKSSEPKIETILSKAVSDELILNGRLNIVNKHSADSILNGEITKYYLKPLAIDNQDKANEYWMYITVNINLIDQTNNNKSLLKQTFSNKWEFQVSNSLSYTQAEKNQAILETSKKIAKEIISSIIEGF